MNSVPSQGPAQRAFALLPWVVLVVVVVFVLRGRDDVEESPAEPRGVSQADYDEALARIAELEREIAKWKRALAATRLREKERVAPAPTAAEVADVGVPEPAVSFEDLRALLMGADLGPLADLLTIEGLEATLDKNGRAVPFLLAASLLTDDRELALDYLEEALEKDPENPAALLRATQMLVESGRFDEDFLIFADDLIANDPSNSLGHYYRARYLIENGDMEGALKALEAGGLAAQMNDYSLQHLPAFEEFYYDAAGSRTVAKTLSVMASRLDALGHLRHLSTVATEELKQRSDLGRVDEALSVAESLSRLGSKMSATSRFMIQDLVAISVEGAALQQERTFHEQRGNALRVQQIDQRLAGIEQQKDAARASLLQVNSVIGQMSEAQLNAYLDRVVREGEAAAARAALQEFDTDEP